MRAGPERDLVDDYIKRALSLSRQTGFISVNEQAIDLKRCKSRSEETVKLLGNIPNTAKIIILDEHGKSLKSRHMAQYLLDWQKDTISDCFIIIGGADGFDPVTLKRAAPDALYWSFGAQTWPHKLVRVMMAEQIYRALSILAKAPYHRD